MEVVPGTAACRWKQLSLLLSSLSSLEVLAELWGCKREHWLGRSGIQGPETGCSVSLLLIPLGLGFMDSDLESVWWFLSWEGLSWEYTEKPVLWRAAVHLLVTTCRELFCFFSITPSTGTSAGNLRRKRFHGHTWPAHALWPLLIRAGCTDRRMSGSFYCYCAWCSCSSEIDLSIKVENMTSFMHSQPNRKSASL